VKKLNHLRAAAHSFEGKVFNLVSSGILDRGAMEEIAQGNSEIRTFLEGLGKPSSFITGPNGDLVVEIVGEEGMACADIDLGESIILKQAHDIVGYYNRYDIFQVRLNQTPLRPITCYNLENEGSGGNIEDLQYSENAGAEKGKGPPASS
jgi:hypothetical protein